MNTRHVLLLALSLGIVGCASQAPSIQWYEPGNLDTTIATLTEQETRNPQDPEIKRNLGIALAQAGYTQEALAKFRTAKNLNPKDPLTLYFYGYCADQTEATQEALSNYSAYLEESGDRPSVVLARIDELSRIQARTELTRAINQEASLDAASMDPSTLAVPNYANLSQALALEPLGRGLAMVLLRDLSQVAQLRIVERQKLNVLQDEIGLSQGTPSSEDLPAFSQIGTTVGLKERLSILKSPRGMPYYSGTLNDVGDENFRRAVTDFQRDNDLAADGIPGPQTQRTVQDRIDALQASINSREVDTETAIRFGKLLAAGTVVLGSYTASGPQRIQLFASIAELSGTVYSVNPAEGALDAVLSLQKDLTFGIFDALGIELTKNERKLTEKLPTQSFAAFLAFCRGLDFEARGMTAEALAAYGEALQIDPDFSLAQETAEVKRVSPGQSREFSNLVLEDYFGRQVGHSPQLYRTGVWIGIGPGVGTDRSDDQDTEESPTVKVDPARITIEGELPGGNP